MDEGTRQQRSRSRGIVHGPTRQSYGLLRDRQCLTCPARTVGDVGTGKQRFRGVRPLERRFQRSELGHGVLRPFQVGGVVPARHRVPREEPRPLRRFRPAGQPAPHTACQLVRVVRPPQT